MHLSRHAPLFVLASLIVTPACSGFGDFSGADENLTDGETGAGSATDGVTSDSFSTSTGVPGDGDGSPGDGDGDGTGSPGGSCIALDCGSGECVEIDGMPYCDCPEGTEWTGSSCDPCPMADSANEVLDLQIVTFSGRFLVAGETPPNNEYDDANLYLENRHTGDRVALGNTHDWDFSVRVTPGLYDVIYEVETVKVGGQLPANTRVRLEQRPLFGDSGAQAVIDIPVAHVSGNFKIDGIDPPNNEYDDANVLFRMQDSTDEILAGNTHFGSYSINLVPGDYDVIYRNETPGMFAPRNIGAKLETASIANGTVDHPIAITSVAISGAFKLDGAAPPPNDYNDANIDLWSSVHGVVPLGNTHDGNYALRVIPGDYEFVYRHETGAAVPQNQHARFGAADANQDGTIDVNMTMITIMGALRINGVDAPPDELDDGVVHLRSTDGEDSVLLGNTHDGVYTVNLLPGSYAVHYAQETAGGTVPENNNAQVGEPMQIDASGILDVDIPAVQVQGAFTIDSQLPPTSNYEDGRVYLRNLTTDDSVLLGSTHEGAYTAIVVPGDYQVYYVQEAGGAVPGNQNALVDSVTIPANLAMALNIDITQASLVGELQVGGAAAPNTASDGGQLYLRNADGDSVLLGNSFAPGFTANLVSGTYGVYYRAEGSVMMPQNENGRFACVTVE